jgi:hypothetical protein
MTCTFTLKITDQPAMLLRCPCTASPSLALLYTSIILPTSVSSCTDPKHQLNEVRVVIGSSMLLLVHVREPRRGLRGLDTITGFGTRPNVIGRVPVRC